jgi:general secretion pathway protein M
MAALSPKRICILCWGAILLVLVVLIAAVALPWLDGVHELDDDIARLEDQSVRYQRLLRTLPVLESELRQVRSNQAVKAFYFEAQTASLAGALLQGRVQDIVKAAGARLISTQILPSGGADQHPARVSIRTQMRCDTPELFELLYAIEQARPFLFVDELSVRSSARSFVRPLPRFRRRLAVKRREQGELTVRLDVYGFALEQSR